MSEQEVIALMESSQSEKEWNTNCDQVKRECNGYPDFWFKEIVMSGMLGRKHDSFSRMNEARAT